VKENKTMQRFLGGLMILALAVPSWAQKIETATPSRDRVVPIHTALDHLTVIEVGEPVVTVAAGSAAFKIEWRDNKVFIEPTEPGVSTNLFIWTASSRLNYELESAGEVGKMDFAIDYPRPTPAPPAAKVANPSLSHVGGGDPSTMSYEIGPMLGGRPVHSESIKASGHGVDVFLKDLFEQNDTLFIRYEIRNNANDVYVPGIPRVIALNGVHSPQSLVGRENSQLSQGEAQKLKAQKQMLLAILDGKLRSAQLAPGEETVGVVEVRLPPPSQKASVLRIDFSPDGRAPVTATLVLKGGA
jgi:hypothetical protein